MFTRIRMKKIIHLLESNMTKNLYQLLEDKKYFQALKILEARSCVSCSYTIESLIPWHISLTAEAYNYGLTRYEILETRIIGFVLGVASGVICTLLIQFFSM